MALYTAPIGQPIIGGRPVKPSWITAQTPRTWGVVPANTLQTIDPDLEPFINPNYPAQGPWGQFRQIIDPWCGACLDDSKDNVRLIFPANGGHGDYAGNQVIEIPLSDEAPRWRMRRKPSGSLPNAILLDDNQEASGLYSDGEIRPPHTYNKCVFVPGVGPYLAVQGEVYRSGQSGTTRAVKFDDKTGRGTLLSVNTFVGAVSGMGACYDSTRGTRGSIWARERAGGQMQRYDVALDSWTEEGAFVNLSSDHAIEYIPGHDLIAWASDDHLDGFAVCVPGGATYTPGLTGSFVGLTWNGQAGMQWIESLSALAVWNNLTSTETINLITIPADPIADPWVVSQLVNDPSNSVTPTAKANNGTYGRWAYSTWLDCFFLINSTSQNFFFYRLN